ncbi:MAG: hypothetical protein Q8L98_05495 [Chlamydiales bacterium]|nr:hypothetical protein [Chlamydiales bacterium]
MSKKRKKRPSLLLEVLLACSLLAMCLGPLIKKPTQLYQTQIKALRELEGQRLADLAFAEIKIKLLNHQIAWDKLPSKKIPQKIYPVTEGCLQIPHRQEEKIARRAVLKFKREKISTKGELVRLLEVEIQFAPFEKKTNKSLPTYSYRAIVRKMNPITDQT